jgi:hypothetical protein
VVLGGSCKAPPFYIIVIIIIIMDGEEMVGSDSFGLLRIVFFTRGGAIVFISLAVLQYIFVVMLSINYSDMCDTGVLIC